jgi:hypothetical protein
MTEWPTISWQAAEPRVLAREREAMPPIAPKLRWLDEGGWEGELPVWPFERAQPPGLLEFLAGRRFTVFIRYPESFPMYPPAFWPLDPMPPVHVRSMGQWHVNPDGSLCLLQSTSAWDPGSTAADLVPKAAGWFLEYLLESAGLIDAMTEAGIVHDHQHDHLLKPSEQD